MSSRLVGDREEQVETCTLLVWSLTEEKGNEGGLMAAPSPGVPTRHCPAPQLEVEFPARTHLPATLASLLLEPASDEFLKPY